MQIQTVKVQRLYQQVTGQLVELINKGVFEPGQRLPSERELADQFGVSRPTIREAMIAMEIADAVEVRSGSGVYVLELKAKPGPVVDDQGPGPYEILEARLLIESDACALAAQRISEQQLQQLSDLLSEMVDENTQDDATEKADEKFHCLIAEAAGNSAISATIGWLWELRNQSELSTRFFHHNREEGVKPVIEDHRLILEALHQRDSEAARAAMKNHLQRVVDGLLQNH
jgi:GntR family transcriptional repressor for pyruvate dehydrogenase complex